MRKTWLSHEGKKWIEQGSITEEQLQGILESYRFEPKNTTLILYVIAGVMCGLGILAAVAANWNDLLPFYKLMIVVIGMSSFYLVGERLTRNGRQQLGAILIGLGVVSFGGGLILCGQMFQWNSYDARAFVLWSLVAIASLFLYQTRSLFLLTISLLLAGQTYSVETFQSVSWSLLFITVLLSVYAEQIKNMLVTWLITGALITQAILIMALETTLLFIWIVPVLFACYVFGDLLNDTQWKEPLQLLSSGIVFILAMVMTPVSFPGEYMIAGLIIVAIILKWIYEEVGSMVELLLFLPFCFIKPDLAIYHLLCYVAAFAWSVHRMVDGLRLGSRVRSNLGSILFLIAILNTYFNVVWDLIPKSVFFFSSGLLLFGINLFLQKQKSRFDQCIKQEGIL